MITESIFMVEKINSGWVLTVSKHCDKHGDFSDAYADIEPLLSRLRGLLTSFRACAECIEEAE